MPSPPSERRLHPVSFVFELASHMRQLLVPGLFVLIAGARGSDAWQAYAMVLFVPLALVSIARTLVFRYDLLDDELVIRSGLLAKHQRHVPYGRIQNIDAVQSLLHRVLRVVDVRLETAGGEEPEAHLKVVSVPAFEEVRARVHAARPAAGRRDMALPVALAGQASSVEHARGGPGREMPAVTLLHLPARELIVSGLIQGRGLIVIGALFGLVWEAGLLDRISTGVFGDAVQGSGVLRQLALALVGQGVPPLGRLLRALGAFAAILIVTRVFSMGWALVRLHGFTLRKVGDDLRTDFGLLTRVAATIPLRRVQSVTVYEGPLHRLFDRVSVHVDTAGGESGEDVQLQRQWLAPVIARARADGLVREIFPAVALDAVEWQPVDRRGVRRARVAWLVLAGAVAGLLVAALRWWTPVVFVALALAGELDARRSVRALGWSVTEDGVFFRSGWLWRRQTIAPFSKVQAVAVRESPFDRRFAMARVEVDTAGTSRERHQIDVPYLPRPAADALAAHVAARASRTTFRW
jgi:putative membrane protein